MEEHEVEIVAPAQRTLNCHYPEHYGMGTYFGEQSWKGWVRRREWMHVNESNYVAGWEKERTALA